MSAAPQSLWRRIDARIEPWLMSVVYAYFCLVILVEVVRRYVFERSSAWGEETARYAFVFLVYRAVAEVAKTREHIRVDWFPRRLSHRSRFYLYLYFDLLYLVLAGLVIRYAIGNIGLSVTNQTTMTGLDVNLAWVQLSLPLGMALLVYRVLQRFMATWHEYREHGTVAVGPSVDEHE